MHIKALYYINAYERNDVVKSILGTYMNNYERHST